MTEEPQHLRALRLANQVRYARAALREQVRELSPQSGRRMLATLLENPSPVLATMRVFDILRWVHGTGPDAARKTMLGCEIDRATCVKQLTPRQRSALAVRLRGGDHDDSEPSDLPPRKHRGNNKVPAAPLARFLEARISRLGKGAGDARWRVCCQAGISTRNLFAWTHEEREHVQVEVAERVLIGLGLNWWDVWDASDPSVVEAWTGETQEIAA